MTLLAPRAEYAYAMSENDHLIEDNTPPIDPELLSFGIGVFQAALSGDLPASVELEPGEALVHLGLHALENEIHGHGLKPEEEFSLMFRVLAFPHLLEMAVHDERTATHVRESNNGYEISEPFLQAAARCRLMPTDQGTFQYDLQDLAGLLVN